MAEEVEKELSLGLIDSLLACRKRIERRRCCTDGGKGRD
jgi:hypothetical protein